MNMPVLHRLSLLCLLAICAVSAYGQSAAPAACPWLTQGTAARVLGGDVSVDVHVADTSEGVCNFVRTTDATTSLRIVVSKAALPSCNADAVKLKGVGNEALRCDVPSAGEASAEKISGRVRDRNFTLTMSYKMRSGATVPEDDALENAAESVAGDLF
jgi:hypothetical protein